MGANAVVKVAPLLFDVLGFCYINRVVLVGRLEIWSLPSGYIHLYVRVVWYLIVLLPPPKPVLSPIAPTSRRPFVIPATIDWLINFSGL